MSYAPTLAAACDDTTSQMIAYLTRTTPCYHAAVTERARILRWCSICIRINILGGNFLRTEAVQYEATQPAVWRGCACVKGRSPAGATAVAASWRIAGIRQNDCRIVPSMPDASPDALVHSLRCTRSSDVVISQMCEVVMGVKQEFDSACNQVSVHNRAGQNRNWCALGW